MHLGFLIQLCILAHLINGAHSNGLDLSLGIGGNSHDSYSREIMDKIMNDDVGDEFDLTGKSISYVAKTLEDFAKEENINPNDQTTKDHSISSWLVRVLSGNPEKLNQLRGTLTEKQSVEMDHVFKTFHSKFTPMIMTLVTERPVNLNSEPNLAFRCERANELRELEALTKDSSLLRVLFDIFSNELYQHCLKRKLAQIKLLEIKPSSVVKQFVDIYLDVPTNFAQAAITQADASNSIIEQITSGLAANFNLKKALEKHGPLTQTASLVLDLVAAQGSAALINKFKLDCRQHIERLASVWTTFDQLANFLSTPTNNLAEFNEQVKMILPQLVYGTVCNQLSLASS